MVIFSSSKVSPIVQNTEYRLPSKVGSQTFAIHWCKNQGGWGGSCPPSLKTRGALPPWFSDCYTSQGVGLTLWLVLALH